MKGKSAGGSAAADASRSSDVRDRILATAAELFYRNGVRAVGVDLIVARSGVAKTSLYRHFRTKDDLVAAFLQQEDQDFWSLWDSVGLPLEATPQAELEAHLEWIGARVSRPNYRGCPQLNVAAEFAEPDHPARAVATAHKLELRRRLTVIAERMGAHRPEELASQLALLIDGAFTSGQLLAKDDATRVLQSAARALIAGANVSTGQRRVKRRS
jgi:AcrR family transcriptional regulator